MKYNFDCDSINCKLNCNFVYAFKSPHNTCSVVNYAATNNKVNSFLGLFEVWGSQGNFKKKY